MPYPLVICECSDCFSICLNDISSESTRHVVNKCEYGWQPSPSSNSWPKTWNTYTSTWSHQKGKGSFTMLSVWNSGPRRHWTCSAYDKNHGMGTPGGTESSERVTHANRVCCCKLFHARSSLIVPFLDSSHFSCKLPINKPSFITNGSQHQSATYFTLSTSAASSK